MIFDRGPIPHDGFTLVMSLCIASLSVAISVFNIIMCHPNDFDPTLIQLEFARRANQKQKVAKAKQGVKSMMNKQKDILKKSITQKEPTVGKRISKINTRAEMIQALGNVIDSPFGEEPKTPSNVLKLTPRSPRPGEDQRVPLSRSKTAFLCDNPLHGGKPHHHLTSKHEKGAHIKKELNYLKMNTQARDELINNITLSSEESSKKE